MINRTVAWALYYSKPKQNKPTGINNIIQSYQLSTENESWEFKFKHLRMFLTDEKKNKVKNVLKKKKWIRWAETERDVNG